MGVYSVHKNNDETYLSEMSVLAINEIYFGLSDELQNIINQLGKFRSKYIDRNKYSMYMQNINTDPDLLLFNRLVEKFFGFGTFSLIIDPSVVQNAFTIAIGNRPGSKITRDIRVTNVGFKYDDKSNYVCCVYIFSGLIFDSEYTDKEIMAIILHEIGHNFSGAIDSRVAVMELVNRVFAVPRVILIAIRNILNPFNLLDHTGLREIALSFNITSRIYAEVVSETLQKNSPINAFVRFFKGVAGMSSDIAANVLTVVEPIWLLASKKRRRNFFLNKLSMLLDPISILALISGHANEKVSDNLPTIYGLGPDFTNAIIKLSNSDGGIETRKLISKTPLLGTLLSITMIPFYIVDNLFDPHPDTMLRVYDQIGYLRRELEKEDIDPKLKKEILININHIEGQIDSLREEAENYKHTAVSKAYSIIIYTLMSGGNLKEIFYSVEKDVDKFDKAYEKAKKNNENDKKERDRS